MNDKPTLLEQLKAAVTEARGSRKPPVLCEHCGDDHDWDQDCVESDDREPDYIEPDRWEDIE